MAGSVLKKIEAARFIRLMALLLNPVGRALAGPRSCALGSIALFHGHRLSQVAGLIDVRPHLDRGMISDQLNWDCVENWNN
jgi:hypothetical protein